MDAVESGRSVQSRFRRRIHTLASSITHVSRIALVDAASQALPFETAAEAQDAAASAQSGTPAQAPVVSSPPAAPSPAAPPTSLPAPPPLVVAPPSPATVVPSTAPVSEPAEPSPPRNPRFGDRGQVALDGALSVNLGHLGYSASSTSTTMFSVAPAFDYFTTPNVSVGVTAAFRYFDNTFGPGSESKTSNYAVGGQVGINQWLGERVSLWPKLGVGGLLATTTTPVVVAPGFPGTNTTTTKFVFVQLDIPFLFHVAEHFFVGFGPTGYADVYSSGGERRTGGGSGARPAPSAVGSSC